MIARLHVLLPFFLTVPEGEKFTIYSYIDTGYKVVVYYPTMIQENSLQPDSAEDIQVNGVTAFRANVLQMDFMKDSFDRRQDISCDPPYDFIRRTVNLFLGKLRIVTQGFQVKPIDIPQTTWRIRYLNNDETEFPSEEGLVRERAGVSVHVSWIIVNGQIWDEVHQLPSDFAPPVWNDLLLDAINALPEVGPAIVLAMTALEVFGSRILNVLAERSPIPQELWTWINNRAGELGWFREPGTGEQFDTLLRILIGVSLKDDNRLWEAFTRLRQARNSFVHEGIVQIKAQVLTIEDVRQLVYAAFDIIRFIRERLPEDVKWPEYRHNFNVQASIKLLGE